LNREQDLKLDKFVNQLQPQKASAISDILMDEERDRLHRWDTKEIFVKLKEQTIVQLVSETLLNLRRDLVSQKIEELANEVKSLESSEIENVMQNIQDYNLLKTVLSEKLRRVL
jgi:DNA primase